MSKFVYLTIVAIFISGCSASPKIENNANSVVLNAAVNKAVVSSTSQPNLNAEPLQNANVTIQNFAIKQENIRNVKGKKGVAGATDEPIAQNLKPAVAPAPDNSEVAGSMNAKGLPIETRTFKNHPVLLKVERTNMDDREIKVYLKSGKVVSLPENQANVFLTATANDILKAVGVN